MHAERSRPHPKGTPPQTEKTIPLAQTVQPLPPRKRVREQSPHLATRHEGPVIPVATVEESFLPDDDSVALGLRCHPTSSKGIDLQSRKPPGHHEEEGPTQRGLPFHGVIQRPMQLHVMHPGPTGPCHRLEGADLLDQQGFEGLDRHRAGGPTKPIRQTRMGPEVDSMPHRQLGTAFHAPEIPRMPATGHVHRGHPPHQGAGSREGLTLPQIAVDVPAHALPM